MKMASNTMDDQERHERIFWWVEKYPSTVVKVDKDSRPSDKAAFSRSPA